MYQRALKTRSATINVMAKAAYAAAKGLMRDFGELAHLQVSKKGPGDFVSAADKRSEKIIYNELKDARPNFSFLMEESGAVPAEKKGSDAGQWIVDPLDGTTNFLHGIPQFCINIALEKNGEIVAGLTLDPIKDEVFWAEKGIGSYLNDTRLRVSSRREMDSSLLATGIPFKGHGDNDKFIKELESLAPQVAGVRRMGSAALDMAYVAAGRFDGYWERDIHPWDVAAGVIQVQEAGGFVCALDDTKPVHMSNGILAGNEYVFQQMKKCLL